jgi:hypothetical protein
MALPPATVAAHGGGALELLETFMMHARRAVALQGALVDDVSGTQPTAGLDAVLERRRLWPSPSATSAHAVTPARAHASSATTAARPASMATTCQIMATCGNQRD